MGLRIVLVVLPLLVYCSATGGPAHATQPADCPVEPDACELVERVADAARSEEPGALTALTAPAEVSCPAPGSGGLGGPFPLCDGAEAGEVRAGVPISQIGSEGGMIAPGEVAEVVSIGFTGPLPATVGYADTDPADGPLCRDRASLVFIPPPCPFDSPCAMLPFVVLRAERVDGAFALRDVVVVPRALIAPELVRGGVVEDPNGIFVLGGHGRVRFFAWDE